MQPYLKSTGIQIIADQDHHKAVSKDLIVNYIEDSRRKRKKKSF